MKKDAYNITFKGHRLDLYVILEQYKISHPCQQHAIKKLLRAGTSHKPLWQEIDEVIWTLNRWKEIIEDQWKICKAEDTKASDTVGFTGEGDLDTENVEFLKAVKAYVQTRSSKAN